MQTERFKNHPTHEGVGALAPSVVKSTNLAFGKSVRASSSYDDNFRPEYAVDDNNGTLWRPCGMGQEWLEIDLGRPNRYKRSGHNLNMALSSINT